MRSNKSIPYTELKKYNILDKGPYHQGKGPFGDVRDGEYNGIPVAIKVFHLKSLTNHLEPEFDAYYALNHLNILLFYGICVKPGKFMMVTELMPYSLRAFYLNYNLNWENIYYFGEQIAQGLGYLHSKGYSHKHIKSSNIFINHDLVIKIADFGLSKIKLESASNGAAGGQATVRWRAPETFTREYASAKNGLLCQQFADIYSYGVLLWEMAARKKPYEKHNESGVVGIVSAGIKEEINTTWPICFRNLLNNCWSNEPCKRPTIDEILKYFQDPIFNIGVARTTPVDNFSKNHDTENLYKNFNILRLDHEKLKLSSANLEKENIRCRTDINSLKFDLDKEKRNFSNLKNENEKLLHELNMERKKSESFRLELELLKSQNQCINK